MQLGKIMEGKTYILPLRTGFPFTPVNTCPFFLPQPKQVPWSHQAPFVPVRVRRGTGALTTQLGGGRVFWHISQYLPKYTNIWYISSFLNQSSWSQQAKWRVLFVPLPDTVTQPLKVDGLGTTDPGALPACAHCRVCRASRV